MRIFYASQNTANGTMPESLVWHRNLYLSLRELGHEVVATKLDFNEPMSNALNRQWFAERRQAFALALLEEVKAAHSSQPLDLFFSYCYDSCITPEVVREIRSLGVLTVNFSCNNVHQFRLVEDIAPAFDYCMVPEKVTLPKFEAINARAIHIQMAANPSFYRPFALPDEYGVTFVGQRYGNRPRIVDELLQRGLPVAVWGPGWRPELDADGAPVPLAIRARHAARRLLYYGRESRLAPVSHGSLSDEGVVEMYSRSKVSLGFSRVSERVEEGSPDSHLRLRDFEAPMSGACYLTGWTEELADYFEPDKEILTYRDIDELVDKARFYLSNSREREAVRLAGRARALAHHKWTDRFRQLFSAIGLPVTGTSERGGL